jgi:hypothetical protein
MNKTGDLTYKRNIEVLSCCCGKPIRISTRTYSEGVSLIYTECSVGVIYFFYIIS